MMPLTNLLLGRKCQMSMHLDAYIMKYILINILTRIGLLM